jgi:hypothetical protein
MQQQPELETRHGRDRLEAHLLTFVIFVLLIVAIRLFKGIVIAPMLVAIEDDKDVVKASFMHAYGAIATLENRERMFNDLCWRRAALGSTRTFAD